MKFHWNVCKGFIDKTINIVSVNGMGLSGNGSQTKLITDSVLWPQGMASLAQGELTSWAKH